MFNLFKIEKKMKKKILLFVCAILCAGAMSAQVGEPLCFTALENGSSVTLKKSGSAPIPSNMYYKINDGAPVAFSLSSTSYSFPVLANAGDKLYVYTESETLQATGKSSSGSAVYWYFTYTGSLNVSGDVTTLIKKGGNVLDISSKTYALTHLFSQTNEKDNRDILKSANELVLPSTTLSQSCYSAMFEYNTSLEYGPAELPATVINANTPYFQMFRDCSSLKSSPIIRATSITASTATTTMGQMFMRCNNLNRIVVNFKSWQAITGDKDTGFDTWVSNVAGSGTFICPVGFPTGKTGSNFIPSGWTVQPSAFLDVPACGWASVCYDKAVEIPTGVKAYYATSIDENKVVLAECEGVIPANQGVMVNAAQGVVPFIIKESSSYSIINKFVGTTTGTTVSENTVYVLNAGKSTADRPVLSLFTGTSIPANKAYLTAPASSEGKLEVVFADEPTGIENIAPAMVETKSMYNLQGIRVNQNYNGIVIMNGKKYLVK